MTATDSFTTPAEAEREARVEQARDRLDAATAHISVFASNATSLNHGDGVRAVRDAQVGQGHAMLAVRDELADIAASLRVLAALPGAVQWLGDNVSAASETVRDELRDIGAEIHDLTATLDQGVECADSTAAATGSVVVGVHELTDAVLRLSEPKPRRWQFWRRVDGSASPIPIDSEST